MATIESRFLNHGEEAPKMQETFRSSIRQTEGSVAHALDGLVRQDPGSVAHALGGLVGQQLRQVGRSNSDHQ